jgi:hypothetical protein
MSTKPIRGEGSEMSKTLEQIAEMARAYFAAKEAHYQAHRAKPEPFDFDNDDHIRWQVKTARLCSASVTTGEAYRAACDEFFKNACPDLIQLLVDVDEYFDGMEDINGNGGPNTAMKCRQQIETFLGPVPAASSGVLSLALGDKQ